MRIGYLILFTLSAFHLTSCEYGNNKTCAPNYVGVFKINIHRMMDSAIKEFIIQKGWDTVLLVSETTGKSYKGKYYYRTNDSLLKTTEGTWRVKSTAIDDDCFGCIKQNNLLTSTCVDAFSISIQIAPERYLELPFEKIKE
jgi:hypothetical protein